MRNYGKNQNPQHQCWDCSEAAFSWLSKQKEMATYGETPVAMVMPWNTSDAIPGTTDSPLRAIHCRRCSQRLHFHLSRRRACENNLLQPDLVVDFPLLFLKTHTKELCLVKSHSVPEKVRRHVDPGCLAEMLLLLLQVLLIVFRASFA